MLGLPQSTEVKRQMPKAQIYKKFEPKQAQHDAFDKDIARLNIVNIRPHVFNLGIFNDAAIFHISLLEC